MKFALTSLLLIGCFYTNAQGVISLPEYYILYRAYDNVITFGAGRKTKVMELESEQLSISRLTDSTYRVRVNTTERTAQIRVRNKRTHKIKETWTFRIMNLPPAVIYWGIYPPGSEVSLDQPALSADYGEALFWTNSKIEIQTFEIYSPLSGKSLRGRNGTITPEIIDFLLRAKNANGEKPAQFVIVAQVKGKDGILRRTEASFMY